MLIGTEYIYDEGDDLYAFTVRTRKDRITVTMNIDWELRRHRNLWANGVRVMADTTYYVPIEEK